MDSAKPRDESKAKGGRARARSLDPERRSQIASDAAKARWRSPGRQARTESNAARLKLHVGASRIRNILLELEDEDQRRDLVLLIWPDAPPGVARLIAKYPGETVVNGSNLIIPQSWSEFE